MYASAQLYAFDLLELDGQDLRGASPLRCGKKHLIICYVRTAPAF
jgi:ATP-dependent DNA ligase